MIVKILRGILCLVGALLFLDGVVFLTIANLTAGTFLTIALGAVLFLYGMFLHKVHAVSARGILRILRYLAYIGLCTVIGLVSFLAIYGGNDTIDYQEDAVIVLGAGLHGKAVSSPLAYRLQTAYRYYQENSKAVIVVTGGKGFQEDITEASAMKDYLVRLGVPADQILMEERSTSTFENFRNSKELLDTYFAEDYSAVLITNRFHIWRATQIAEDAGLSCGHLHADLLWFTVPMNYLRECAAVMKYLIVGR